MKDKVQNILTEIVKVHSISVIAEKGRFKGMLLDRMNAPSKEVRAILECVNSGIGEEIISEHSNNLSGRIHIWKYKLVEEIGMQESLAEWALETLITVCDNKVTTKTIVPVIKESKPATSVSKEEEINQPKDIQSSVVEDSKYGTFTDPRDGRVYKTVKIGNQVWMAENLNYDIGDGCWFYDDDPENGKKYGRLYTWEAAMSAVPEGWHLPSEEEFETLLRNIGGDGENIYKQIIKEGSSGFNALFAGRRKGNGSFSAIGIHAYFWSYTENSNYRACCLDVYNNDRRAYMRGRDKKLQARSVRCIKNTTEAEEKRLNISSVESIVKSRITTPHKLKYDEIQYKSFTDARDGKLYKTVKIGDQIWMAENLNYDAGDGCWFYDNDPQIGEKYGRLYTWNAAKRAAPKGWHLPSKEEFEILLEYLGGEGEIAYEHIISGGSSGFEAIFGGHQSYRKEFYYINSRAFFWSSSEYFQNGAWSLYITIYNQKTYVISYGRDNAFSVRCIRD